MPGIKISITLPAECLGKTKFNVYYSFWPEWALEVNAKDIWESFKSLNDFWSCEPKLGHYLQNELSVVLKVTRKLTLAKHTKRSLKLKTFVMINGPYQ